MSKGTSRIRNRRSLYFSISLILSVGLLWYLFSRITFSALFRAAANIYLPALLIYFFLAGINVIIRAYRYYILIVPRRMGLRALVMVTLVRNLFVDLLPARLGSLSYVYLLVRRFGFPFEVGASTFLVALLFDLIAVTPLIIIAILTVGIGASPLSQPLLLYCGLVLLVILGVFLFYLPLILRVFSRLLDFIGENLRIKNRQWVRVINEKTHLTVKAVEEIKERGIYRRVFLLSLVIRGLKYGGLYFLLYAILANEGFTLANLNFWKVFLGIAAPEVTAVLPVHGIAGFGTWETAWKFAFQFLGFPEVLAITSGMITHGITQLFEYSMGIGAIIYLAKGFSYRDNTLLGTK